MAVAPLADLGVEPLGAAAARVPPLEKVGQVRIEDARPPPVPGTRRGLRELPVAVDGALAGADPLGDVLDACPRQVQPPYVSPPLDQAFVALLGRPLDAPMRPPQRDGQRRDAAIVDGAGKPLLLVVRSGRGGLCQRGSFVQQEPLQSQGEAMEEVPAIRDLRGIRGAPRYALPVDPGAVARRHLDPGMPLQPSRQAFLGTLGQEVHHLVPFQIHQDRAVGVALPEGEVVHAQDDREQSLLQPIRLAGAGREVGQPLAEDPPLARGLVAEEAPGANLELDRDPVPGQVGDGAAVTAVYPGRAVPADRAARPPRPRCLKEMRTRLPRMLSPSKFRPSGSRSWAAMAVLMAAFLLTRLDGA